MTLKVHETRFYYRKGQFKAECTCGWTYTDSDLEHVQTLAAVHDLIDGPGYEAPSLV